MRPTWRPAASCSVPPQIDRDRLRAWKNRVVTKLTNGLALLAKQRKVDVVRGEAKFVGPHSLEVQTEEGPKRLDFKQCIIAAGSESARLPGFPDDPRVIDSSGALELPQDCKRLLVVGGGIIGLEMACVYDALGATVTVVELSDGLMPGTDRDLVRPLQKRIEKRYAKILAQDQGGQARGASRAACAPRSMDPMRRRLEDFDRVLVAVGRSANGNAINAAAAGVAVDKRGIIAVDKQMRTNVPHIFAIGDIVGAPMLAHKATHEAKVAAEVAAGHKAAFDARCIPSVAYTDPEIAWVGVNETDAKARGIEFGKGMFPWAASGRSLALNRDEGFTKILFDKQTRSRHRRRHRRHQRRRFDRGIGARDRNGSRCRGYRLDHPCPSDAIGDRGVCRGGVRGDADGSLYAEALGILRRGDAIP